MKLLPEGLKRLFAPAAALPASVLTPPMSVVVPLMAPVFKLESTAHNLNTQYRKRMRQLAKLTESIDALQQMVDDSAHIRPSFSYESDVDRIEGLQKAARRRLGLQ